MKGKKVSVLIVDDNDADFILMKEAFSDMNFNKYTVAWCDNYEEASAAISKDEYDLYLVDYKLGPDFGVDLIKKAKSEGCQKPFILITGFNKYDIDVKAMESGASSFISKDEIGYPIFERTIRYTINSFRDKFVDADKLENVDKEMFLNAMNFNLTKFLS